MRTKLLTLTALLLAPLAALHAADAETSGDELLRLTAESRVLLQRDSSLLTLEPVLLPRGRHLLGVNDHFGWPVSALAGKTIVVVFHRKPQHWNGKDKPDSHTSTAVTVRSTDGGTTWSEPVDLKRFVQTPTKGCRLGFGNTIGTDAGGAVVVVTGYGVFRSEDEGASWQHLSGAFGQDQREGPKKNNGPRLALHPEYGLIAPGHHTSEGTVPGRRNTDGNPVYRSRTLGALVEGRRADVAGDEAGFAGICHGHRAQRAGA